MVVGNSSVDIFYGYFTHAPVKLLSLCEVSIFSLGKKPQIYYKEIIGLLNTERKLK